MMQQNKTRLGLAFAAGLAWLGAVTSAAASDSTMFEDKTLPEHTLYAPSDLGNLPAKSLPVVVWGNGACGNAGNAFERYLLEISAHGFLVIASGPITDPVGSRPRQPDAPPSTSPPKGPRPGSTVQQMIDAIDWAQAEAKRGTPLGRAIDPAKVAVAGQSCGGLQALSAASDPRVKTAVIFNSGVIRAMPTRFPNMPKPDLTTITVPMLYVIGGQRDIAYQNAEADFQELTKIPLYRLDADVGHDGSYWDERGGPFAQAAWRWLAWRLKGDAVSAALFQGSGCGLCQSSYWTLRRNAPATAEKQH